MVEHRARHGRLLSGGAPLLLAAAFLLSSLGPPAQASLTPMADYAVTVPYERYLEVAPAVPLADSGFAAEQAPEIHMSSQGLLVVAYLNYSYPVFMVVDPADWSTVRAPFFATLRLQPETWSSTTAFPRGNAAALDSRDHLIRVYLGSVSGRTVPFYRVFDLAGGNIRLETQIAPPGGGDTFSYGVTSAENDTFLIVRATSNLPSANRTRIALDKVAAGSSLAFTNMTLFNDSGQNLYPHIARNAVSGFYAVSWVNGTGFGRVLAIRADGSTVWGPVVVGNTNGVTPALAVAADGGMVAAWSTGTQLHALKLDASGNVEVADTTVLAGLSGSQGARPVATTDGDVYIVWSDNEPTDGDVRAIGISSVDLSVAVSPAMLTTDDTPSAQARPLAAGAGSLLVVWSNQTAASPLNSDVLIARMDGGGSGFDVRTPGAAISLARGDHLDIPVSFSSLATPAGEYRVAVSASNFRGLSNWTVALLKDGAPAAPTFTLAPGEGGNFTISVDPPLVDPAGYGAFVNFAVVDSRRPAANATLSINVTVVQGHRFAVTPADANATVIPGASVDLAFSFRNNGSVPEVSLPMVITLPAPAGWSASLSPASFSAAPGSGVAAVLTVTVPANATSTDKFCARVRVQSSTDPYAVGSAAFCVQAALVVEPSVEPPLVRVSLDPGASALANFTVGNAGNAGNGVVCHLALVEMLPSGWSAVGNPADFSIPRNSAKAVSIVLRAPSGALGGLALALTAQAWCDGSATVLESQLDVTVNDVHAVRFTVAGSTVDTDATGASRMNVTVENLGNVPERVVLTVSNVPLGWTQTGSLVIGETAAAAVPPFSTASFRFAVQAPPSTLAGSYGVNFSVATDQGAAYTAAFTVRVPKTYGIAATFAPTNASATPGGALVFEAPVSHMANTADSYTLRVEVAAPQLWIWKAEFVPDGGGASSYFGATLALEPFATGRLLVNLTVPREPYAGDVSVLITLSSTRGPSLSFAAPVRILLADYGVDILSVPDGSSTAGAGVTVRVWNHGNHTVAPLVLRVSFDGRAASSSDVGMLFPGQSVEVVVPWEPGPGDHTVAATVDPADVPGAHPVYGAIFESDERNNGASRSFTIEGPAEAPPDGGSTPGYSTAPRGDALVVVLFAVAAGGAAFAAFLVMRRKRRPH